MESSLTAESQVPPSHRQSQRVSFHLSGLPSDITVDELHKSAAASDQCKIELLPLRANVPHSKASALIHFDDADSAH